MEECRLRYIKGEGFSYDTIFQYSDKEHRFDLTDGDNDSYAGSLEEWCLIDYSEIPNLIKALKNKNITNDLSIFTDKQKEFYNSITNENVKNVFPYIVNSNFSMSDLIDFCKENNIKYEYSAYRSAGDW